MKTLLRYRRAFVIPATGIVLILTLSTMTLSAREREDVGRIPHGGDASMVSSNRIRLAEVDRIDLPATAPPRGVKVMNHPGLAQPRQFPNTEAALQDIKKMVSTVFAPTYLPDGFTRVQTRAIPEMPSVELLFAKDKSFVIVAQHTGQYVLKAKRGHASQVSINGNPGYLVTGGWGATVHRDGTVTSAFWDDSTLELVFEHGDWWIILKAFGEDLVGQEELLAIARSIAPI